MGGLVSILVGSLVLFLVVVIVALHVCCVLFIDT